MPRASRNTEFKLTGESYVLLPVRELAEQPLPPDNVFSLLVGIETVQSVRMAAAAADAVFGLLGRKELKELREEMLSMIARRVPEGQLRELFKDTAMAQALHDEGTLLEQVHKRWAEQFDGIRLEGIEQGIERGVERGLQQERVRRVASQRRLVGLHAASRFGEDETAWLADSLADIEDPDLLDSIGGWIGECRGAAELDERIRTALPRHW